MDDLRQDIRSFKFDVLKIFQELKDDNQYTRDLFRQEIKASERRVILAVAQMVDGQIAPQIGNHEVRLAELETQRV